MKSTIFIKFQLAKVGGSGGLQEKHLHMITYERMNLDLKQFLYVL